MVKSSVISNNNIHNLNVTNIAVVPSLVNPDNSCGNFVFESTGCSNLPIRQDNKTPNFARSGIATVHYLTIIQTNKRKAPSIALLDGVDVEETTNAG